MSLINQTKIALMLRRRHTCAFFRAASANSGAVLAVIIVMPAAFIGTGITDIRTQLAK
jgi:hypothetical protein